MLRTYLLALAISLVTCVATAQTQPATSAEIYGQKYKQLETLTTGEWWKQKPSKKYRLPMNVERDKVVAFAVYAHDHDTLKMTAQLYPLMPDEPRTARLELKQPDGTWKEVAQEKVFDLGWSAHFRIANWDNTKDVVYRVRHGDKAEFEGLIRKDPIDKDTIVIGNLSCNSSKPPYGRKNLVKNIKLLDPDMLFFAGDQSYHHLEHTFGWLEFGVQFAEVLKDRPVVTIPDDHDVGQANIWGEGGIEATNSKGTSGGYFFPAKYVNQVERCQTWHLPDAADPTPVQRRIGVYYTNLVVGGIDFAIVEDRKFKSGPQGKIPKMGPRPDHINDPKYDRASVDVPGLKLLGDRQLEYLRQWSQDWAGAEMKCVLSQTAFCGAVHLHGSEKNRLLADLDSNAWPQTGRNKALIEIRRAWAPHLCGDQHLGVVVKHGIEEHRDGPYAFTSPAIVNTVYGRWWHPPEEEAGPNPVPNSPLPWTGDYLDGLGNKINMMAYANPPNRKNEKKRGDGFGIARFKKSDRTVIFEAWPRFCDASKGDTEQFPGWPITINYRDNDGRKVVGYLPEIVAPEGIHPVIQVIEEESGEVLYSVRAISNRFRAPVYSNGSHTIRFGNDKPNVNKLTGLKPEAKKAATTIDIKLPSAE